MSEVTPEVDVVAVPGKETGTGTEQVVVDGVDGHADDLFTICRVLVR